MRFFETPDTWSNKVFFVVKLTFEILILFDRLYSRHFWRSTIKHNSTKCIKHAVKRYYVHNKRGNVIYEYNKNVVLGYDM